MFITFPNVYAINESRAKNPVRQIGERGIEHAGVLTTLKQGRRHCSLFRTDSGTDVLILRKGRSIPDGYDRVLRASIDPGGDILDLSGGTWLKHPSMKDAVTTDHRREIDGVLESWVGAFSYVEEDTARGVVGLRRPQIGAVHAMHAHWSVSNVAATIVMPTGTGKTETMLSVLISACCTKLLVVVPTEALRIQLADKFLTLGILKSSGCNVLSASAKHPVVCTLLHIPRSVVEVDEVFVRSQVIVTTSSVVGQSEEPVQERMASHCPYLFIDEAHHAEAPTWKVFKSKFRERRILQFTATPFREDGKPLDGDIIFRYPLKKAQEEGYFRPIRFKAVTEFNETRSDEAIARKAVEQLRADADRAHILMARVETVARAKQVFELYSRYPEFKPVQLHSGIKSQREREKARRQILSGESRIVVCVDMLGEGFDLPELKIAAFHDIRKTLPVTLQLAGRFTRARPDLGDATFVANTADVIVQDELRKLYTRDPDWNVLLPQLSDSMIGEQQSLQDFLRGFTEFTKEIPLKTVRPATSTVVYRTTCDEWMPQSFRDGIPALGACEQVHETLNEMEHTLIVVTARRVPLAWTDVESLFSWAWELYVLIWLPEQKLLFINSSMNAGEYKALAEAVTGRGASLIKGQQVFRAFAGVNRLRLQNVGLTEQLGKNVRYTARMGANVGPGVPEAQRRRTRKSVLSGTGYEGGERTTVGASRKGRIWSHRRNRVDQLVAWCKTVGAKLLDDRIDPEEVLKGTLETETVSRRPAKMPISVDWPEEMYTTLETFWSMEIGEEEFGLDELSLELVDPNLDGTLKFVITSESASVEVELQLLEEDEIPKYRFVVGGDQKAWVRRGSSSDMGSAEEFFYNYPPIIWFSDGSSLEGNQYVELKATYPPYDAAKITAWDWRGVNIMKESQGKSKDRDSIQARVIRELMAGDFHMIVDDDDKGEAADVVAIRLVGDVAAPTTIELEFYHCKYSTDPAPGQRIHDLYVVCGQAQKSFCWMSSPEKRTDLFTHLMRREARRNEAGGPSRYELGDGELLHTIREMSRLCPVSLEVFIVQPGVSKANATRDQLTLMSVTENYLYETYQIPFGVIASA